MFTHRRLPYIEPIRSADRRVLTALTLIALGITTACRPADKAGDTVEVAGGTVSTPTDRSSETLDEGKRVFRIETFGDEQFWTDTARMHEVVAKPVPSLSTATGCAPSD